MTLEKIKCPNCNATIKIYPDDIMVTCEHCGDVFHVNDGIKRSEHKIKHTDDAKVERERAKRDIEIERIKAEAEVEKIKVET